MKINLTKNVKCLEEIKNFILSCCDENKVFDGDIDLSDLALEKLPDLSDIIVTGNFECYYNNLTSLNGSPKEVGGDFDCSENKLTSLEGCPEKVGGYLYCPNNEIMSLEGCPAEIGGKIFTGC